MPRRREEKLVGLGGVLTVRELLCNVTHTVAPHLLEELAITDENAVDIEHEGLERHIVIHRANVLKPSREK
jgi:hypothetical protein